MSKPIKKILIANRGEIAVRIMRTCREMGIRTVAVYSEADRRALFVSRADEACYLGPAPAAESYLCIVKIIAAAKKTGAQAIHPGYGFLSENAVFSQACRDNGIVFLGPRPRAMRAMGDKIKARLTAQKANLPVVPGTVRPVAGVGHAKKLAREFGYPILLKAAAGGGGKGMRVVRKEGEMASSFALASQEALKAFGDGRLYLEKFISHPRHVEIQFVRDTRGNAVHLYERECSMQRRHQKVIEEAPCPYLKNSVRQKMTKAALSLAHQIDYHGVGTVEFLVDEKQGFYFLEMNTRLQVEHCVTEMITGLDLVRLQILIGQGDKIPFRQSAVQARGHAVECRIYAEDPENNFLPSPGKITWLRVPEGPGIRHDSGVYSGAEIPIHYDPMIAKLVVYSPDRETAIQKMSAALHDYRVGGIKNNVIFLKNLLQTEEFLSARMDTQFIDSHPGLVRPQTPPVPVEILFATAAVDTLLYQQSQGKKKDKHDISPWWHEGLQEALDQRTV